MKRDPTRPKAADLTDSEMLYAVDDACANGTYVGDAFPGTPGKVVASKLRKLEKRGWIQRVGERFCLTPAGREVKHA